MGKMWHQQICYQQNEMRCFLWRNILQLETAEYLSSSILEEQVFDGGLHGDIGSDQ